MSAYDRSMIKSRAGMCHKETGASWWCELPDGHDGDHGMLPRDGKGRIMKMDANKKEKGQGDKMSNEGTDQTEINETLIDMMLSMDDRSVDPALKSLLRKLPAKPSALQWLEVLDHVVHGALGADLVVYAIKIQYDIAVKEEGTTHAEVIKGAKWRK